MLEAIQLKALELVNRMTDAIRSDERGQTTAEYVAVTAVGVALAIGVLWVFLHSAIQDAVTAISDAITGFVGDQLGS